jgi:hypothetical protein
MSRDLERNHDLEANSTQNNRISKTPTVVNSVKLKRFHSTSSVAISNKSRNSDGPDVPAVPAVPLIFVGQHSNNDSSKVDKDKNHGYELDHNHPDPRPYGERDENGNKASSPQDLISLGPQQNQESNDIVGWGGSHDQENPLNWSSTYKWYVIMILACMTFVVSFGSSVWSTATIVTAEEFGVSQEVMILGVTFYVIGIALGPLVFGPLSELYGRRNPLMIGMLGFIIFSNSDRCGQNPSDYLCL